MSTLGAILSWIFTLIVVFGPLIGVVMWSVFAVRGNRGRLHLSTMVLLCVLSSAFLGLNLTEHDYSSPYHAYAYRRKIDVGAKHYGWPFPVLTTIFEDSVPCNVRLQDREYTYRKLPDGNFRVDDGIHGDLFCACWNLILAMVVLLYAYRICERTIRSEDSAQSLAPPPCNPVTSPDETKRAPLEGALS